MLFKITKKIIWLIEQVLIILLGVAIVIITLQIVFRYLLNSPISWSEQTARCLFIWMMMLGVPVVFYKKSAMCFDLILVRMKGKLRKAVDLFIKFVILGFSAFFFYHSLVLCIQTGNRMTAGITIPQNALYISMPISMLITCLIIVCQIIEDFSMQNIEKGTEKEEATI